MTTTIYATKDVYGYLPQSGQYVRVSDGLIDACTQSGYSYNSCQSMLYGSNPGGYCNGLDYCPQIQDPGYTYSDPYGAMRDSQQKSGQIQGYIDQWDYLYPPRLVEVTISNESFKHRVNPHFIFLTFEIVILLLQNYNLKL